jgi:hypothetical protein
MCKCVNVAMGSYDNQTALYPPFSPEKVVGIDNCLLEEIISLWESGIVTLESCCGHNRVKGYILVDKKSIEKMQELGYERSMWYYDRPEIFKPKSC